jgi:glycosyltransferase involved in cell wall biosynthesis
MTLPLITIITPSFNRAAMIREAIESVLGQAYQPVEHIVVDGASSDGTLEVLREYEHLRVISEPDQGMYDAINKGLEMASGEIIGLLNTDDWYPADTFKTVARAFADHVDAMAVVGGAQIYSIDSGERHLLRENPPIRPDEFWFRVIKGHPVTNAWFFRREVFERVGHMNSSYRFAADREFLIRVALAGIRPSPVDSVLYHYRQHAGSATIGSQGSRDPQRGEQRLLVLKEGMRLLESFLNQKDIPPEARYFLKSAHSRACYRATATALYHRHLPDAIQGIRQGWQYDNSWPLFFICQAWHRLLQEFGLGQPF